MLAFCKGRIYHPACGAGGSLPVSRLHGVRFAEKKSAIAQGAAQSEKFVESHGGKLGLPLPVREDLPAPRPC